MMTLVNSKKQKDDLVMITRWSAVKKILSDSSIRDIPEIANEDFLNVEIVFKEVMMKQQNSNKQMTQ